ncbi:beta-galactosidase [Saccharibacillus sp. CPCC 101409]|uniref:beta-galactosidase n=1 Tax=Saccharibacillus sp. CPCC 101409 TaxID=3058041 RepID=UPI0026730B97|nr:beta-galactosidase [Saccharibacillus sp. CPCC 101409]MDO3409293.1 beta-galactosidase [Saccharibacillus sp. CPCC 101409]
MTKPFPPISPKLPVLMHGADYNPDQWLDRPDILDEDIRLMKLAGCNVMAVGIFSWASLEPEEGVYRFDWLDRVLDRFAQEGIYAWLATPSGARPAWMSAKYPEVLRTEANRVRNLHGMRHNHCWSSPVYREKTAKINSRLAERYARHPAVIGWHISNEYGGDCHCEYCQSSFREWLKERYGSLEALNAAWWTSFWAHTYTDWSQVESPAPHGENMVHGQNLDWRRFVTHQTVDFCRHEIEAVRGANPELPATTNMHMIEGVDYRKFADLLDVISWDAYPTWHEHTSDAALAASVAFYHDLFRSIKHRPFLLMESTPSLTNWQAVSKLKRPGMHRLSSLQAIAHGSDSVQYFQWRKSRGSSEKFHGAVVDHAGHDHTRVFGDAADLGRSLGSLSGIAGAPTPAETAILFDWDNRWAVKDAQGPRNSGLHYEETAMEHHRALWERGVPADVIGSGDSFDDYRLIVAPMLYLCSEDTGRKLEAFVERGGTLVTTYWSGVVDEHDLCHLGGFPGPLRRTLGIWAEEIEGLYDYDRNGVSIVPGGSGRLPELSGAYEAREICELIHAETAEVLGVYTEDFYADRPALTVNRLGEGSAYHLATRLGEDFLNDFYAGLIRTSGVKPVLGSELPPGVTAQLRRGEEQDYVFLLNFSGEERQLELDGHSYTDAETGEPVPKKLTLPVNAAVVLSRRTNAERESGQPA